MQAGWTGIVLSGRDPSLHFAARISDLVDEAGQDGPLQAIAIDMPIGLPDAGRRMADTLARQAGGPLPVRKSTWAGAALRRQLLADAGIPLAGDLGIAGEQAAVDEPYPPPERAAVGRDP